MQRRPGLGRFGMIALSSVALIAAGMTWGLVAAPASITPKAHAVSLPSGLQTGFILDGSKGGGNPNGTTTFNWNTFLSAPTAAGSTFAPTSAYTAPGGLLSTGINAATFSWDGSQDNCATSPDLTAAGGGQKIDQNPWSIITANVGNARNLCSAAYASETLTDPSSGAQHVMLYGYFTRFTGGTASVSVSTLLQGPGNGRCGDLLLTVDYPAANAQMSRWTPTTASDCTGSGQGTGPGTWTPVPQNIDFLFASGVRTEGPGTGESGTFGEFAIDLTTAGLFSTSQCSSFSVPTTISRSSNSPTSSLDDFMSWSDPLTLSNCGTLTVTKKITPPGTTDDSFGFAVTNGTAGDVVKPPSATTITDTLTNGQTKTYNNVFASDRLHLSETDLPTNWQKVSVICTHTDGGGTVRTTDVTDPSTPFVLEGGGRTDCVITNNAALVTVKKATLPVGNSQTFDFTLGSNTTTLTGGGSATFAVPAGTPLTVAETDPAAGGWATPTIACDGASQTTGWSTSVTPVLGENLTCAFTNSQLATVTIQKQIPAGAQGTSFDFTTDLGPGFTLTPTVQDGDTFASASHTFEGVTPGDYSVSEAGQPGFSLTSLACWDDTYDTEAEQDTSDLTAEISVQPGSQITCSFENLPVSATTASLAVNKITAPMPTWDQNFPVTVTGPDGYSRNFNLNTIGVAYAWTDSGLVEGDYTITEGDVPGWTQEDIVCRGAPITAPGGPGESTTVHLTPGTAVSCDITNTAATASVKLTKTVSGAGDSLAWSFDTSIVSTDSGAVPDPPTARLSGKGSTSSSVDWAGLTPGKRYVITEATPSSDWDAGAITCTDQNGDVQDLDTADLSFTFVATIGQDLTCGMTNTPKASVLNVRKIVAGTAGHWSFDMEIAGDGTKSVTLSGTGQQEIPAFTNEMLTPGSTYTISEPGLPPYVTSSIRCTGTADGTTTGDSFVAPLNGSVACLVTNIVAPVTATITKTTSESGGVFTFAVTNLDVSDDVQNVAIDATTGRGTGTAALIPGNHYSVVEAPADGWVRGPITCQVTPASGGAATPVPDVTNFVVAAGDTVACSANNSVAPGQVVFTKIVAGVDTTFGWSFPVTLTPTDPAGEAVTKMVSGTGNSSAEISWADLDPGTYTLSESGLDGWTAEPITCGALTTRAGAAVVVTVTAGAGAACSATNTANPASITVLKKATGIESDAAWGPFTFTMSPAPSGQSASADLSGIGDGIASHEWTGLTPGTTYTVTETPSPGWSGSIECTAPGQASVTGDLSAALIVTPGVSYTCTSTNAAVPAKGTITKTTVGGDGSFPFVLTPLSTGTSTTVTATTSGGTGSVDLPSLTPGQPYSLVENAVNGWQQTTPLACTRTPLGGSAEPIPDLGNFTVSAGDVLACTATNTKLGKVIIFKESHGVAGKTFDFTSTVPGHPNFSISVPTENELFPEEIDNVAPGTYSVTETADTPPNQTQLADLSCTYSGADHSGTAEDLANRSISFGVDPGATTTCFFTNAVPGTIILIKRSVPSEYNQDFGFTIDGPSFTSPEPFDINPDTNVAGAIRSWSDLEAGSYTITEDPLPTGWSLDTGASDTNCSGDPDNWSLDGPSRAMTINLQAGGVVTCFFSNRAAPAQVSVSKSVSGADAALPWSFPLTISPSANVLPSATQTVSNADPVTGSETATWTGLTPGVTYTLQEPSQAGWTAGAYTCTDVTTGAAIPDADTNSTGFQFVARPALNVSCSLVNTAAGAGVTLTKTVSGVSPDLSWSFQASLSPTATPETPQLMTGTGNTTASPVAWTGLVPGRSYTLTEAAADGWARGVVFCNGHPGQAGSFTFTAHPGQTLNCTISNAGRASGVTLTKTVTGASSTLDWSFPVTITPSAGLSGSPLQTIAGTGQTVVTTAVWGNLVPGTTYTVTENVPPGWTFGGVVCTGTTTTPTTNGVSFVAGLNQQIGCTISNSAHAAEVSITKTVKGVAPDYAWSFPVSLTPDATPTGTQQLKGTGDTTSDPVTFTELVPGTTYTLAESVPDGWTSPGVECSGATDLDPVAPGIQFTPTVGQSISCSVENTATAGRATLTKSTIGGDGTFTFTLKPRVGPSEAVAVTTSGEIGTVPLPPLVPGIEYSLDEGSTPGWEVSSPLACTVTTPGGDSRPIPPDAIKVDPGESVSCNATNEKLGHIVIVKAVKGADSSFDFTGSWLHPPDFSITTSGGTGSAAFEDVVPGRYTVTELPKDGYENTDLTCTGGDSSADGLTGLIDLTPGSTVTCTYSNTEQGVLVVDKSTVPSGATRAFDFAWGPSDGAQNTFTLKDGGTPFTSGPLAAGDYTVSETEVPGWVLQSLSCTGSSGTPVYDAASATVHVALGDTVVCSFANQRDPQLEIAKTVSSAPQQQPNGDYVIGYRITVHNKGTAVQTYDLDDGLRFGSGLRAVSATVAPPGGVTVDPGWNGTSVTRIVSGVELAAGETHVYTVTVTAAIAADSTDAQRACAAPGSTTAGGGFLNGAQVRVDGVVDDTTQACADAPAPPVPPAPGPLPPTGSDLLSMLALGLALAGLGVAVVIRRRRRNA